jgi:hypothetical protein
MNRDQTALADEIDAAADSIEHDRIDPIRLLRGWAAGLREVGK